MSRIDWDNPTAPTGYELALDDYQRRTAQAARPVDPTPIPCRTTLPPGGLCDICWTDHDKDASA